MRDGQTPMQALDHTLTKNARLLAQNKALRELFYEWLKMPYFEEPGGYEKYIIPFKLKVLAALKLEEADRG